MSFVLGDYRITGSGASAIAADIEGAVGSGALPPGTALPPLRDLARALDVNPNTVAAAYRQLRDRGVIETAGRRGSRIIDRQDFGVSLGSLVLPAAGDPLAKLLDAIGPVGL